MALPERLTVAGLPETYFVPRDGAFSRVTASDPNQLRIIRTELELLRRIKRRVETCSSRPGADVLNHFAQTDRDELLRILQDANHQCVPEMIELFDREFPEIRKDILMSVVNDEAGNIVQEAAEAGLANSSSAVNPGERTIKPSVSVATPEMQSSRAPFPPPGISSGLAKALDEVEAALDETAQLCQDGVGEFALTPRADQVSSIPVRLTESAEGEAAERAEATPSQPSSVVAVPTPISDALFDAAHGSDSDQGTAPPPIPPQVDAVLASTVEGCEMSDQTMEASNTIEQGVRSMAAAIHHEVAAQWTDAQTLLAEVAASGERASASQTEIEGLLLEIRKLRDDARSVADEFDQARQQARRSREDARRAKERAEASADAAELAADQASRDAIHANEYAPHS